MKRQYWIWAAVVVAIFVWTGCAEKEECVRERGHRVRVRAPFTSVDVFVPDDEGHDTDVDVDVDD